MHAEMGVFDDVPMGVFGCFELHVRGVSASIGPEGVYSERTHRVGPAHAENPVRKA